MWEVILLVGFEVLVGFGSVGTVVQIRSGVLRICCGPELSL